MSLLSPLFLLGLLGVALPLWLHRLQTQTTEREKFSSTMFLEPSKHRIHVQRKLKYLLLLALRILLLVLLALAFARPVLNLAPRAVAGPEDAHHVIVLDSSFSMQAEGLFAQAVTGAESVLAGLAEGDEASLYSAAGTLRREAAAGSDPAELRAALSTLRPGNGRLDLGQLIEALNAEIRDIQAPVVLHLFSDFQNSAQPVRFADLIPDVVNGRPVSLDLQRVTSVNTPNWLLEALSAGPDDVEVLLRGHNTEAADKTVQLLINGTVAAELSRSVPANGQALYRFTDLAFAAGDNRLEARILEADALPADDRRFGVLDNSPPSPVPLLTSNPASLAVTYISAALATAPRPYEAQVLPLADLDARILSRYPWLIIEDLGMVNASLATALTAYLNEGGSVLAALGERSVNLASLPLSGHVPAGSLNLRAGSRRNVTRIDSSHPTLAASASWASLIVNQALPLQAAAEDSVLISLDGNTPFLLERRIGQGRFMLFNTALDNSWTDLPLRPVFVGFMAEAARYLSGESVLQREQLADSILPLQSAGQVFDPAGNSLLALEATAQAQDVPLRELGHYRVVSPSGEALVAVNPDPRESDLRQMPRQVLQNWQNTVAQTAGPAPGLAGETALAAAEGEGRQVEVWRLLLVLFALMVLAESLLGNRYLRYNTGAPE